MTNLFRAPIIINAVLFQILWFSCVVGGAKELLWPSILAGIILATWQLQAKNRHQTDVCLILAALIMGLIIDTAWTVFGVLEFAGARVIDPIAPVWILILWVGFSLTVNHSMSWLNSKFYLPAAVGFIGGPMSYLAGLRLGAVDYLMSPWIVSLLLGIVWAIALTILVKISQTGSEPATETVRT